MLSLYLHIPFCEKKCSYCSFFVLPTEKIENKDEMIAGYVNSLEREIDFRAEMFPGEEIKTLYFGGGTPLQIGKENIFKLIEKIRQNFDCSFLEEINFELNPGEEVFDFIDSVNKKYRNFFRIRYSFGIQTFDDDILRLAGRGYIYNYLIGFLRKLKEYKTPNNIFNFDFIAFGKFNRNKKTGELQLWNPQKTEFFRNFVNSLFPDSFSVYMLELFPGSYREKCLKETEKLKDISEEGIYEEYLFLKDAIVEAGYKRYEVSNFALPGKDCLHNKVYWNMENYIGLGINASSFLNHSRMKPVLDFLGENYREDIYGIRFKNVVSWRKYGAGDFIDSSSLEIMREKDYSNEKFFLSMRMKEGITDIQKYENVLIKNYQEKLEALKQDGLIEIFESSVRLTEKGFDMYNFVVTELLEEI